MGQSVVHNVEIGLGIAVEVRHIESVARLHLPTRQGTIVTNHDREPDVWRIR
jgi:hypothetical protein